MAYSETDRQAAQVFQDWLNSGNQWMWDMAKSNPLGYKDEWDWFFTAQPQLAPYRDAIMNYQKILAEPAAPEPPPPPPAPTPAPTQTQSSSDPNIGKIYQRIQDIPEGYDWKPTTMFGTPMTNMGDIIKTIEAANRGELTDYQKQFTYQVTQKKPEGVLTQEAPGLYSFTKDGKEYIYSPKDFVKYGAFGQENVQSTSPEGETLNLGKKFTVNPLLQSKELLDKATKTNIDPKQYQVDFSNSGITDPTQGYVWRKQDYINTVNSLTGGAPTAYNYNPSDALTKGQTSWFPEQYGTFQGRDANGNYIYRQGRSTTTFDPKTGAGSTYTPGDSGFGDLMPILAIVGIAIGAPFLGELGAAAAGGDLVAGEALGATLAEAGFGELSAAELASLGYDASWAETLGALPGVTEGISSVVPEWDPTNLATTGQGAGDIAANQAFNIKDLKNIYNIAKTGYNLATSNNPLKVLVNSGVSMGTSAITSEIPGFNELTDAQKKIANSVIASTLTGQDPTQSLVNSALNAGVAAVNITSQIPGYDEMTGDQRKAVDNAISTTLRGGNPTKGLVDAAINAGLDAAKSPYEYLRNNGLLPQSTGNTDEDSGQTITPDDSSPSGYRDIIGNPVNYDGTPYVPGTGSGTAENPQDVGQTELTPSEEPQCAPGWTWNGSMCVLSDEQGNQQTECPAGWILDVTTGACVNPNAPQSNIKVPTGGTTKPGTTGTTTGTTKTPTGTTTGTTTGTPTGTSAGTTAGTTPGTTPGTMPGTTGTTTGATPAMNSNALLALLALGNQGAQAPATPTPLTEIKYFYDFGDDLLASRAQDQTKKPLYGFFDGGEVNDISIDDLIEMLKGD